MDRLYFKIKDFCITGDKVPIIVADKIMNNFIVPLSKLRSEIINFPVFVSQNSGYRPYLYEKKRGRSGKSEHVFKGEGAADLTCYEPSQVKELYEILLKHSDFTRVCYYPNSNFVHADYKTSEHKAYIDYSDGKGWRKN